MDIRLLCRRQRHAACEACILRPRRQHEGEHGVRQPATEDARDSDCEDEARKCLHDIHDAHEQGIRAPAEEPCEEPDETAARGCDEDDEQGGTDGCPCTEEDAREKISAVVVRSTGMGSGRRLQDQLRIGGVRIVWRELCREKTDDKDEYRCSCEKAQERRHVMHGTCGLPQHPLTLGLNRR